MKSVGQVFGKADASLQALGKLAHERIKVWFAIRPGSRALPWLTALLTEGMSLNGSTIAEDIVRDDFVRASILSAGVDPTCTIHVSAELWDV